MTQAQILEQTQAFALEYFAHYDRAWEDAPLLDNLETLYLAMDPETFETYLQWQESVKPLGAAY